MHPLPHGLVVWMVSCLRGQANTAGKATCPLQGSTSAPTWPRAAWGRMGQASHLSEGGDYADGAQGPPRKGRDGTGADAETGAAGLMDKSLQLHQSDQLPTGPLGPSRPFGAAGSFLRTCSCAPSNARCCSVLHRTLITSTQQDARNWPPHDARMLGI